jgi:hypothetical protein
LVTAALRCCQDGIRPLLISPHFDERMLLPRRLDFQPPLPADAGDLLKARGKLVDDREGPSSNFPTSFFV